MIDRFAHWCIRFAIRRLHFWGAVGYMMATGGYTDYPEIETTHFTIRRQESRLGERIP